LFTPRRKRNRSEPTISDIVCDTSIKKVRTIDRTKCSPTSHNKLNNVASSNITDALSNQTSVEVCENICVNKTVDVGSNDTGFRNEILNLTKMVQRLTENLDSLTDNIYSRMDTLENSLDSKIHVVHKMAGVIANV
jgi:hypothetical protein